MRANSKSWQSLPPTTGVSPGNWTRSPRYIWRKLRPIRGSGPYARLGEVLSSQGQYEKAIEITRQAVQIASTLIVARSRYDNHAKWPCLAPLRQSPADEHQESKLDNSTLHAPLSTPLGFLGADFRRWQNSASGSRADPKMRTLDWLSRIRYEAYGGRLGGARKLTKRAVDSAVPAADNKESGAIYLAKLPPTRNGLW